MSNVRQRTVLVPLVLALLAGVSCRRASSRGSNIVLVTVESLRADRLLGKAPDRDPLANLRALAAARGTTRRVLASSSDTLPSLASLLTGLSPGRHSTMVGSLDRLAETTPTLASTLAAAGYSTAGFPSLGTLGLSSGLCRGFSTYGWPPSDRASSTEFAQTDGKGWVAPPDRRPGEATVGDALGWLGRHRAEKVFLWVHLSEACAPYATDRELVAQYPGSLYDAALAYDDRYVKSLVDGITSLGLSDRTTIVVAGDHGESLGAHGEEFHGLNLYPAALETAAVVLRPGSKPGEPAGRFSQGGSEAPGRLIDLFALIVEMAGAPLPAGIDAVPGLPSIAPATPLFAATLVPRAAFGWNGHVALYEGDRAWTGPSDEDLFQPGEEGAAHPDRLGAEHERAAAMRARALALAGPLAQRLEERKDLPAREARLRVLQALRDASEGQDAPREQTVGRLREAWALDPGNFQIAAMLAGLGAARGPGQLGDLIHAIESRFGDMPEGLLAVSHVEDAAGDAAGATDAMTRACASAGAGCTIELALRLARAGKGAEAVSALAPLAESHKDPDLWRTLGDLYLSLENSFRAGQAFGRAASLRPNDPDLSIRQGDCLAVVKDWKGAAGKYEAALAILPGLKLAERRLGVVAAGAGDRKAAVEHFRRGLEVDTNTPSGAIALGRLLAERGMVEEAVPIFLDAASRDTHSGTALYFAAETLAAAGKLQDAEGYLRQSLEREPDSAAALYQLARLMAHRGDAGEAGTLLARFAKNAPPNLAQMALQDQLFSEAPPDSPIRRGLDAIRASAQVPSPARP